MTLQVSELSEKRCRVVDSELSEHAYDMLQERNIREDWVKLVMEDPERREPMDDGTVHLWRTIFTCCGESGCHSATNCNGLL